MSEKFVTITNTENNIKRILSSPNYLGTSEIQSDIDNINTRIASIDNTITEVENNQVGSKGEGTGAEIFNSYDLNVATGEYSHAEGHSSSATKPMSHAEGYETQANGLASHSEGRTTIASGADSHAEGEQTTASGESSHSEGYYTKATGKGAHAEGYSDQIGTLDAWVYVTASGKASHAEGYCTNASGNYSHAEGEQTNASSTGTHTEGYNTRASKSYSHAEGYRTTASGAESHAEGQYTIASGQDSHAEGGVYIDPETHEGTYTTASGVAAHAEGSGTKAISTSSSSHGSSTIAGSKAFKITGYNSTDKTYTLDSVEGLTKGLRFSVWCYEEKRNYGNITAIDKANKTVTVDNYYDDDGAPDTKDLFYIMTKPELGTLSLGDCAFAEGKKTMAPGIASHAEGKDGRAYGHYSHSEGLDTSSSGEASHAEGFGGDASGYAAHVEGSATTASGDHSHAEGFQVTASGLYSHSEGTYTSATGEGSHAENCDTIAQGNYSHAEGTSTKAISKNSSAHGFSTVAGSKAFKIISFNDTDHTYTLDSVDGLEIGDAFSLKFNANYDDYGKITAIDNATKIIAVDNYQESENATNSYFRIPAKPEIGTTDFGIGAFSEGENTIAAGDNSHAEGKGTNAYGRYAHTEGKNTTAHYAGHAEGVGSKAYSYAHAEGDATEANAYAAHSEGVRTKANGEESHSEGYETEANSYATHAEGTYTHANGVSSHVEGYKTKTSGENSHAEGNTTEASGAAAHSEGIQSLASGDYSHAEGGSTTASGNYSHAEGYYTKASSEYQHVQGKYNIEDSTNKYAHIIGNGTSDTERSNAHTIDWDGNTWFKGVVKIGGISYEDTEAKKVATIEDIKSNLTTVYKVKGSLNPVTDSSYITDLIPNGPENGDVYNISATSDSGLSQSWQWDDDSMPEFEVIDEGTSKTLTFKDDSIVSKFRQKCGIRFKYKDSDTFDYMNCNGTGLTYDIIDSNTIDIGLWFGDIISEGTCFLKQIDTDDKVPVTKGDNVVWVEGYGWDKLAANINLFDSSSSGGLNQKIDGDSVFDFTDANPNATALDSTLTGNIAKGAIGDYAVSFGGNSAAIGKASLTEGKKTIAKGQASHAEGIKSVALGYASHSEGGVTTAGGIYSHAEGKFTVANGDSQHVQGKYNIIDSANKYAHIVGNGTDENSRSNAHTLDWNGNAWFKGDLKIGGTSYDDGETLIKKPELSKLKKQSIPQGKAEGYPAKITDGLAGESPLKLNVYGNSGKNMLKATDFYSALQKLAKGGDNILYEELEEDGRKCVRFIDNFTARYQILPFKENTQYTISMDCRTKNKTNENTIGSTLFVFFYTDGTFSDAVPLEKNTPWTHKTATSKANKTISAIGIRSRNFANWCYVDVDTFQLEEGAAATDYEAFDGVGDLNSASGKYEISVSAADYEKSISGGTLTATLDRQLSPGEYIDLIGKKLVSAVGETDITVSGELEIPETETCYISAGTEMSPEKIEAGYYQDINKVLANLKALVASLTSSQTT